MLGFWSVVCVAQKKSGTKTYGFRNPTSFIYVPLVNFFLELTGHYPMLGIGGMVQANVGQKLLKSNILRSFYDVPFLL
jgi:hypothetical protein